MRLKKYWLIGLMLTCLLLTACGGDELSPEENIKNTITLMEQAAEDRSLSRFMEHVSKQYGDHEGNTNKAIAQYVQLNFIRNQSINIFSHIQSIEINEASASVEMSVAMGAKEQDLSDESTRLKADTMHFSILFNKINDKWLVKSVSWRRGW